MDSVTTTLPNGQQIIGEPQADGTVRVAAWPKPTTASGRPFMSGILARIIEADYPEDAARLRAWADRVAAGEAE